MSSKEVSSFFTGFFIGALVGGAAALLLAPQSGEETRAQIREKGIELKDKAEETYGDVVKLVEESTGEITAKLDELIAQGKQEFARLSKTGATPEEAVEEAAEAAALAEEAVEEA